MNAKTMQAIVSTGYGGPEILQLQTVTKPVPQEQQVLVKIHAAAVTRAETMMRTGYPLIGRLMMGLTKPKHAISGTGFAGVVEAVGSQVTQFQPGDAVFGESLTTFGTYAEYVCVDESGIISHKPKTISDAAAAVVGDGPITSWNFLRNVAKLRAGQHILINGASGSLGTAAVQLAKHLGATVTGVCSTDNVALVQSLGADHVIDYTKMDFTDNGQTYDVIYDTVGKSSFKKAKRVLTKNGIYMSPVLKFPLLTQMLSTRLLGGRRALFSATGLLPVATLRAFLADIKGLLEQGKLRIIVDRHYPLAQTATAHRYIDTGHKRGNVVIKPDHAVAMP